MNLWILNTILILTYDYLMKSSFQDLSTESYYVGLAILVFGVNIFYLVKTGAVDKKRGCLLFPLAGLTMIINGLYLYSPGGTITPSVEFVSGSDGVAEDVLAIVWMLAGCIILVVSANQFLRKTR